MSHGETHHLLYCWHNEFQETAGLRRFRKTTSTSRRLPIQYTTHDTVVPCLCSRVSLLQPQIQKGLRPRRSVRTAMANEINMYGIVQKDVSCAPWNRTHAHISYPMSHIYTHHATILYDAMETAHSMKTGAAELTR